MKELKHASEYIPKREPSDIELSDFEKVVNSIERASNEGLRTTRLTISNFSDNYVTQELLKKGFVVLGRDIQYIDSIKVLLIIKW